VFSFSFKSVKKGTTDKPKEQEKDEKESSEKESKQTARALEIDGEGSGKDKENKNAKQKFNLASSLARPLNWKLKTGKLGPMAGAAFAVGVANAQENKQISKAEATNPKKRQVKAQNIPTKSEKLSAAQKSQRSRKRVVLEAKRQAKMEMNAQAQA